MHLYVRVLAKKPAVAKRLKAHVTVNKWMKISHRNLTESFNCSSKSDKEHPNNIAFIKSIEDAPDRVGKIHKYLSGMTMYEQAVFH